MLKRLANLLQDNNRQLSLFDSNAAPPEPELLANPRAQREVLLGQQRVPYELKRARRRSIGFVVGSEGLRVSAPRWVPLAEIERALGQKSDWIQRKLVEQRERARRVQASRIDWCDGASVPYLGQPLTLALAPSQDGIAFDESTRVLSVGLPLAATGEQIRDSVQAWLQRQALADFEPRCRRFAEALGVSMKKLKLSAAQTRWGSASADGTIRLHWKLVHFAPAIIDYVVAHELAHLREMNHSPRFWDVVRSVLPDFEGARDRLREESITAS